MKKCFKNYFRICLVLILISSCQIRNNKISESVVPILFDTDMESDVDDVGALAMLHALADSGKVEILGVISCAENPWSILCVNRINTYYNRSDIPLGQLKRPGVNRESRYAQQVAIEFPGTINSHNEAMDAVDLYRKSLASQSDNSVIILTVGYLTNLRDLLVSKPDNYSELSGMELVQQKVNKWICMGGMFPSGREANIRWDTEASIEVAENWPTEIIFCGWEIGNMDTAGEILNLPENNPVRRAYELFGRIPHKSWDQVATLYAVNYNKEDAEQSLWKLSEPGQIIIDKNDGSNIWNADPDGSQKYLIQISSDTEIADEINKLMLHNPI